MGRPKSGVAAWFDGGQCIEKRPTPGEKNVPAGTGCQHIQDASTQHGKVCNVAFLETIGILGVFQELKEGSYLMRIGLRIDWHIMPNFEDPIIEYKQNALILQT